MTSEASIMEVFQNMLYDSDMIQIWFVVLICLWPGLVLHLWFWHGFRYDFDVSQNCDLMWVRSVKITWTHIRLISESHQDCLQIASNHIKNISKLQKHIKTTKKTREIASKPVPGLFLFPFCFRQPMGKPVLKTRPVPHQNHEQNMAIFWQNHI